MKNNIKVQAPEQKEMTIAELINRELSDKIGIELSNLVLDNFEYNLKVTSFTARESITVSYCLETALNDVFNTFEMLKRNFEIDFAKGIDYTNSINALAKVVGFSCLRTICDPQARTSYKLESARNSGFNSKIVEMKENYNFGFIIFRKLELFARLDFDKLTKDEKEEFDKWLNQNIPDSYDFFAWARHYLLECAKKYSNNGIGWLDKEITIREKLKRKTFDHLPNASELKLKEETLTPLQMVYRNVRQWANSNKSISIENDLNAYATRKQNLTNEKIYIKTSSSYLTPISNIYGTVESTVFGKNESTSKIMTLSGKKVKKMSELVQMLKLDKQEKKILYKRLNQWSLLEIATFYGLEIQQVRDIIARIQRKYIKVCKTPQFKPKLEKKAIAQLNEKNEILHVWGSASYCEKITGYKRTSIIAVCKGKREKAYNYKWAYYTENNKTE